MLSLDRKREELSDRYVQELRCALGAYGVPWIVVRPPLRRAPPRGAGKPGEPMCFFGSDRFEQIAFLLGERWDGPRGPALAKL